MYKNNKKDRKKIYLQKLDHAFKFHISSPSHQISQRNTFVLFDTTLNFDHKEHFYYVLVHWLIFSKSMIWHYTYTIWTLRIFICCCLIYLLAETDSYNSLHNLYHLELLAHSDSVMSQLPDFFSPLYLDIISKDWGKSGNWRAWGPSPTLCNPSPRNLRELGLFKIAIKPTQPPTFLAQITIVFHSNLHWKIQFV